MKAGRLGEARAELLAAWTLKEHYQIAANLGAVELRLGQNEEAARHLEYFLRQARGAGVAETEIRQGERMLAEAQQRAEVDAATASTVLAKAAEAQAGTAETEADAGSGARRGAGAGADAGAGAGAAAESDAAAEADAAEAALARAQRRARVGSRAADGARTTAAERVEVGVAVRVRSGPEEVSRPVYWPALAAAGVAVAGIGVGVGATVAANDADREADRLRAVGAGATLQEQNVCPGWSGCDELEQQLAEKDRFTDLAMAGYAVGGVAALGAAMLLIWPVQRSESSLAARVAPMPARQGGGFVVSGSF